MNEKKHVFSRLVEFIDKFPQGEDFTRKELFEYVTGSSSAPFPTTLDNYRNQLTRCEYIISLGRGLFRKVSELPEGMTSTSLLKEYKQIIAENKEI